MTKEKPAELCSSIRLVELEATNVDVCKKRPDKLAWIRATLTFVGGFGRVLKFVDDVVEWWNNLL